MRYITILLLSSFIIYGCKESPAEKKDKNSSSEMNSSETVSSESAITEGEYICWRNEGLDGRKPIGDMWVKGNKYGGDLLGEGAYTYDPATRIVRFNGGGYDQRSNGDEWIGVFYKKGEQFIESDGKAANTMLIITTAKDWNNGLKQAWMQQCDLK